MIQNNYARVPPRTYFNALTAIRRDRDIGTNRTLRAKASSSREEEEVTLTKPPFVVAVGMVVVVVLTTSGVMRPVAKQNDWYNLCEGIVSLSNGALSFGGLTLIVSRYTQNLSRRSFLSSGVSCLC